MTVLQEHRNTWEGKSDEWLFERLNNELKSKVEEIHKLLNMESNLTKQIEEQQKEIEKLKESLKRIEKHILQNNWRVDLNFIVNQCTH